MFYTQYGQLPEHNSGLYDKVSKRYLQSLAMREIMRAAYLWHCGRECSKTTWSINMFFIPECYQTVKNLLNHLKFSSFFKSYIVSVGLNFIFG